MRRAGAAAVVACLVVAGALPAAAYPRPGTTERVSVATDGSEAKGTFEPNTVTDISPDGRYVVFGGWSRNLAPALADRPLVRPWLFLRDRQTGVTELLSVTHDGKVSNGGDRGGKITPDGRYVAFRSSAGNLVPGSAPGNQIFLRDRWEGTVELVSRNDAGEPANGTSFSPAITPDGRYVAFSSSARNLVESDKPNGLLGNHDLFVRDRVEDTIERVSVATGGEHVWGGFLSPKTSDDGRFVAFESDSGELDPPNPTGNWRAYVHDRETQTTTLVSVSSDGEPGDGDLFISDLSADGRHVVFATNATNLVPNKRNTTWDGHPASDVYVHDRDTGVTQRVSVSSDGVEGNDNSWGGGITPDGRVVTFVSEANNLVPGDTNNRIDVFVHDRETGVTERVSVGRDGQQGIGDAMAIGLITADGGQVAFNSPSTNLTPDIGNDEWDVFVRDRGPALGVRLTTAEAVGGSLEVGGWATFSGTVISAAEIQPEADALTELLNASLNGASLTYRHEHETLQARLDLASASELGGPGVVYGMRFTTPESDWEVRATALTTHLTRYTLLRCDAVCVEEMELAGGYATTGPQVRVTIPLDAVRLDAGDAITGIEAFTAMIEGPVTAGRELTSGTLPDAAVPEARVEAAVTNARTGETVAQATFAPTEADFAGALDVAALSDDDHLVAVRACLGAVCDGPEPLPLKELQA